MPVGLYAQVDYSEVPDTSPSGLQTFYTNLLSDSAVSGIWLGISWATVNPNDPNCTGTGCLAPYDFSAIDALFAAVNAVNADPNTTVPKTVVLSVKPGFRSPQWLLSPTYMTSCHDAVCKGADPTGCGFATFDHYPEQKGNAPGQLPLPWNGAYQTQWIQFQNKLFQTYKNQTSWVATNVSGPTGPSDEIMLPNTTAGGDGDCNVSPQAMWKMLSPNSKNPNDPIVQAWTQTIFPQFNTAYSGLTLILTPDNGERYPRLNSSITDPLFNIECPDGNLSCKAVTAVVGNFLTLTGTNALATQLGGFTSASSNTFADGDMNITGVKLLTSPAHGIVGGAEFDHNVSAGMPLVCAGDPEYLQLMGCPSYPSLCPDLTVEQGIFNALCNLFQGTMAAQMFHDQNSTAITIGPDGVNPARLNYVTVRWQDILYAQQTQNMCTTVSWKHAPNTTAHFILESANRRFYEADMANAPVLPPVPPQPSCTQQFPQCPQGTTCQPGFGCTPNSCPNTGCGSV